MGKIITNTPCHCTRLRRIEENVTAFYNRCLAPAGVTARQFALLRQVSLHPGCSVRELADITQLDRSTLARNLKPLFKAAYLEDRKEAKARNSQLHLTATGTAVFQQALPLWQAAQSAYVDIVGTEDVKTLERILMKLQEL